MVLHPLFVTLGEQVIRHKPRNVSIAVEPQSETIGTLEPTSVTVRHQTVALDGTLAPKDYVTREKQMTREALCRGLWYELEVASSDFPKADVAHIDDRDSSLHILRRLKLSAERTGGEFSFT
jgi:hypothetical protein